MIIRTVSVIAALCSLFIGASSNASSREQAFSQRPTHRPEPYQRVEAETGSVRIVVKFLDGSGVRASADRFALKPDLADEKRLFRHNIGENARRQQVETANSLIRSFGLSAAPLIRDSEATLAQQHDQAERYWKHEVAELATYSQLVLADGGFSKRYTDLVAALNALEIIEVAYIEPIAETPIIEPPAGAKKLSLPPPPANSCALAQIPADLGDLTQHQNYMGPPPLGTHAFALHGIEGGRGEGVRVIDVEGGAFPHADHPDLLMNNGIYYSYAGHGQMVLGLIGAKANGIGTTGMAPEASTGIRSIFNSNIHKDWSAANNNSANTAHHIYWAGKHSLNGVVLIELQRPGPEQDVCPCNAVNTCTATPLEFWPADFDVIQTAVGNGITVVEAAANGGRSLDHPIFEGAFDVKIRDSGAILATGSESDGVTPMCHYSAPNHGSRISLHSWGKDVATTGDDDDLFNGPGFCYDYTKKFNGSSSASAIIAGAAAALQGVHLAAYGKPADPAYLRKLMISTGTPQAPGTKELPIGPQPDLLKAAQEMVK